MKKFMLGFLITIVLIPAGIAGYLRLGLADVRGDVNPPAWQDAAMHFAVRASVRRRAAGMQGPPSHTDADLIAGGKLYLNGCAGCHGALSSRPLTHPLSSPPPRFALSGTQYSEPELFWIIKHGIRRTGMSAYGDYNDRQTWTLAEFVQRMKDLPPSVRTALEPRQR